MTERMIVSCLVVSQATAGEGDAGELVSAVVAVGLGEAAVGLGDAAVDGVGDTAGVPQADSSAKSISAAIMSARDFFILSSYLFFILTQKNGGITEPIPDNVVSELYYVRFKIFSFFCLIFIDFLQDSIYNC